MDAASHDLTKEFGDEAGSDDEGAGGGGGKVVAFEVTDLDVFRQLVLNRLTADDGAGRSAQRSAGSAGLGSSSSSSFR
ncbi:unnamed protein product, partial [Ectocarpus sp. 12 AP-2014]